MARKSGTTAASKPVAAAGPKPCALVYGDDDMAVERRAREVLDRALPPAEREFGLETIDAGVSNSDAAMEVVRRAVGAINSPSFFAGRRAVWLKNVSFLGANEQISAAEESRAAAQVLLEAVRAGLPRDCCLLVTASRVDGRTAFAKAFKALADVHECSLPEREKDLAEHTAGVLAAALRERGVRMERAAEEQFLMRVGPASWTIHQEVEKLALYCHGRDAITEVDVRAVTSESRESALWDLDDAFGKRDLARALHLARNLRVQKIPSFVLMGRVHKRARELLVLQESLERGWCRGAQGGVYWDEVPPEADELLKGLGDQDPRRIHPYRQLLLSQQARNYRREELVRAIESTARCHHTVISSGADEWVVLDRMLVTLMRRRAAAA